MPILRRGVLRGRQGRIVVLGLFPKPSGSVSGLFFCSQKFGVGLGKFVLSIVDDTIIYMKVRPHPDSYRNVGLAVGLMFMAMAVFGVGCAKGTPASSGAETVGDVPVGSAENQPAPPSELSVPILVYHHVREPKPWLSDADHQYEISPEQFAEELAYLKEQGFSSVSLADIAAAFSMGRELPAKPVVITFDDGRDSQYANAFPLLKEYGFTATFFVFTNAVGRPDYLTWEQLGELRDAGMEIGSHTVYHPYLTKASDEELERELSHSRAVLQEKLGVTGDVIAYPFGLYDERIVTAARAAGYVAGRGLDHTILHKADGVMTLGAYIIAWDTKWFAEILAGGIR